MSTVTYTFKVNVTCQSCVDAINRSLQKSFGSNLKSLVANVEAKEVILTLSPDISREQAYKALEKTGKAVSLN